ncbi:Prophage tail fibre N-terminal [Plesiomonas shigelloides]|uniref:phage head spike fiber domain-containing protein n=1 Tax=Plesiomonas shigelloides TaxID=703 RepID=UPI000D81FAD7|nr:LamG-like jellyroll fold domain-containing protein [Plesiomonas shigelloides]SPZ45879.1 Prophage tail fibre N-terminal [Plesiomonas shigelloides]
MIRVFGQITDASGKGVAGAMIELRALKSSTEVLYGSVFTYKCDASGHYEFPLAIGAYDAYAQNDICGDMDYLGTAVVTADTDDGDLHHILVDGGINITPPMLDTAMEFALRAEKAATSAKSDRIQTGKDVIVTGQNKQVAETKAQESATSADEAKVARDSIVQDANEVRHNTQQVAANAASVASNTTLVQRKAEQVAQNTQTVSTKAQQVSENTQSVAANTQAVSLMRDEVAAKISMAQGAADTASQKAVAAAASDTSARTSASQAVNSAAAAKSEADRAKSEADRASQAVIDSAVPLPDVWAPLSDSLRMITGYGRNVLVGSDVVSRMVNFSRNSLATGLNKSNQLESYPANTPRFSALGVLGEPSSSNYITTSEGLGQIGVESESSVVTENGVTLVRYAGIGGLSKDYSAPASTALTLSFYVKIGGNVGSTINVQMRDGQTPGFTASISVSSLGALSVSNSDGILSSWRVDNISSSVVRVAAVIKPSTATLYRLYRGNPAAGETFGSLQLEPMPFATSYIKTAGAVTTRVADSAYLPSGGNRFYKPFFTVALSWSLIGIRTDITDNRLIDFDNDTSANRHYVGISQSGKLAAQFGTNRIVSSSPVNSGVSVLVVNGATFSLYHDGVKIGEAQVTGWSGSPNGRINLLCNNTGAVQSAGYVRDLRMWMLALTDAQVKGVK